MDLGVLEAFVSDDGIGLRWQLPKRKDVTQFQIERQIGSSVDFTTLAQTSDTTYFDVDIVGEQVYRYRIAALKTSGKVLGYSQEVSVIARNPTTSACVAAVTLATVTERWWQAELPISNVHWNQNGTAISGRAVDSFQLVIETEFGDRLAEIFAAGLGDFVAWSRDDRRLVFGGVNSLSIVDFESESEIDTVTVNVGFISTADWDRDDRKLAIGSNAGAYVWDSDVASLERRIDAAGADVSVAKWRDSPRMLSFANAKGDTIVVDADYNVVAAFDRPGVAVRALYWLVEENALAIVYADLRSQIVDAGDWATKREIQSGYLSPAGHLVGRIESGPSLSLYDSQCGKLVGRIPHLSAGTPAAISWSKDGYSFALAAGGGVGIFDVSVN